MPQELQVPRDRPGQAFASFGDSIVRAAAGHLGISALVVHTDMRVNVRDGGVDTQVDVGGADQDERLGVPTL